MQIKYNLAWSRARALDYIQSLGRAANTVFKLLDVDVDDLTIWIATGDKRWERCKKVVKYWTRNHESWHKIPMYSTNDEDHVRAMWNYLRERQYKGLDR